MEYFELLALVQPEDLSKNVSKVDHTRPRLRMRLPSLPLELPSGLPIPLIREISFVERPNAAESFGISTEIGR